MYKLNEDIQMIRMTFVTLFPQYIVKCQKLHMNTPHRKEDHILCDDENNINSMQISVNCIQCKKQLQMKSQKEHCLTNA